MNKIFLTLALALWAAPLAAQQALNLDWDKARRLALENNPSVKAARAVLEQADYSYFAGLNAYQPQISLSHGFSRSGGEDSSPANRWNASVSASQEVWNLRTLSTIKNSRISKEKAEADYLGVSASVRQSMASAFADLLFAQRRVDVQKKIYGIRQDNAKLIRLKYESGMESKGNALYTEALAASAAVAVKRAERQLSGAQRALLELLGLDVSQTVKAEGNLSVPSFALADAQVTAALDNSPRMRSAKKTLEASRERAVSARYYAYPSLRASGSYGWSGAQEFPDRSSWSLGLNLSLPLFSGGPTYYANTLKAAKKSEEAAEQDLRAARLALEAGLRNGYDDYLSAAETAQSSVALLAANQERYSEAQIKYMAGKISFLDLANVEQNFVDTDLSALDQARAAHARKLALEQQLGTGLEERGKL